MRNKIFAYITFNCITKDDSSESNQESDNEEITLSFSDEKAAFYLPSLEFPEEESKSKDNSKNTSELSLNSTNESRYTKIIIRVNKIVR